MFCAQSVAVRVTNRTHKWSRILLSNEVALVHDKYVFNGETFVGYKIFGILKRILLPGKRLLSRKLMIHSNSILSTTIENRRFEISLMYHILPSLIIIT